MNAEQFVAAIRQYVAESAIVGTRKVLLAPPGRKPAQQLVESSQWFNVLDSSDQEQVMQIAASAVHDAMFSFMCVLDGARVIDDQRSEYHLLCVNPQNRATVQLTARKKMIACTSCTKR